MASTSNSLDSRQIKASVCVAWIVTEDSSGDRGDPRRYCSISPGVHCYLRGKCLGNDPGHTCFHECLLLQLRIDLCMQQAIEQGLTILQRIGVVASSGDRGDPRRYCSISPGMHCYLRGKCLGNDPGHKASVCVAWIVTEAFAPKVAVHAW
jgi:hypothetical protein